MDRRFFNQSTERIYQIGLEALSGGDIVTFHECLSELSQYRTRSGGEWYAQDLVDKERELRRGDRVQYPDPGNYAPAWPTQPTASSSVASSTGTRDPSSWWGAGWTIQRLAEILGVRDADLHSFAAKRTVGSGFKGGRIPDPKSVEWLIYHADDFGYQAPVLRARWDNYKNSVLRNTGNRRGNTEYNNGPLASDSSVRSDQPAGLSSSTGAPPNSENVPDALRIPSDYESEVSLGVRGAGDQRRGLWKAKKREREQFVIVKVFSDLSQIDHEAHCLERAQDCAGVPKLREVHKIRNDPSAWMEMEWINGEKLDSWIEQNVRPGAQSQYSIARELIRTVMCIHARAKVAHCDIKPSNIMVESATGRVYLIDFGSAVPFAQAESPEWGRNGAHRSRTLRYAPPEALKADYAESTTEATLKQADVFSLAATIWEMLSGLPPLGTDAYSADSEAKLLELYSRTSSYPVGEPEFPTQAWRVMLEKSLDRDPAKRLNSIGQMLNYIDPGTVTL